MSVLIYIDATEGQVKKSAFEILTYGADLAKQTGTQAEALVLGTVNFNLTDLGKYGVSKIHHVANSELNNFDAQTFAKAIADAAEEAAEKQRQRNRDNDFNITPVIIDNDSNNSTPTGGGNFDGGGATESW